MTVYLYYKVYRYKLVGHCAFRTAKKQDLKDTVFASDSQSY